MEAQYRLSTHIRECALHYLILAALFIVGLSSGAWFYHYTKDTTLCGSMVHLFLEGQPDFGVIYVRLFLPTLLLCLLFFASGLKKQLLPLAYLLVLYNGIMFGSSVAPGFSCGFFQGLVVLISGLVAAGIRFYLVAVNGLLLQRAPFWFSSKGMSREKSEYIRIYISVALVFALLALAATGMVNALNHA